MKPTVGQKATRTFTITEAMLRQYADLTGDLNPIHFEEDFTKRTRFGERIAHGGITTGIISALVGMELPGPGSVFMSQHLRFTNPAYVGDTLTATIEVKSVKPEKPVTELIIRVTRQDGAPVLEGEAWVYTVQPDTTV